MSFHPPALMTRGQPGRSGGRSGRPRGRSGRSLGQSLAEFALVAPILLGMLGATVDFSRAYELRVKLESATRDAAEFVAGDKTVTSSALALTRAKGVICAQFGLPSNCTSPTVVVNSYASSSTAAGGSVDYPRVTVSITSSMNFQTLFPYPFLADRGATTLEGSSEFTLLRGR